MSGFSGQAGSSSFGDGSAASPSIFFVNDTNTGFYRTTSPNGIGMTVDGTQRAGLTLDTASLFVPLSVTSTGNTLSLTNGAATLQFNSTGLTTNRRVTMNYGSIINQTNTVGVDDNIVLLQTDGVFRAVIDRDGNFSTAGQSIRAGNGENNEKYLVMYNSARYVYFYNQDVTGEVGLYDEGTGPGTTIGGGTVNAALIRWKSDTSGNFTVAGQTRASSFRVSDGNFYYINTAETVSMKWDGTNIAFNQNLSTSGAMTSAGGYFTAANVDAAGAIYSNTLRDNAFGRNTGLDLGADLLVFILNDTQAGYFDSTGLYISGTYQGSDARLKKDVTTISNALDKVKNLRGVNYTRISNDQKLIGVIAQELQEVIPELVAEDREGMLSVAYSNLVGLLIEAIKDLDTKVQTFMNKSTTP